MTQTFPTCLATVQVCPNPVFVIGSPRSGTSALAWALAQHSQFWTSGESHVLKVLFAGGWAEHAFERARKPPKSWFQNQHVGATEFVRFVGLGINALFTSRSRGRRWVDQTP